LYIIFKRGVKFGVFVMDKIIRALKLARKNKVFVGSVNENDNPNIKAMHVAKRTGIKTYYFVSNNSAIRTKQFKHNNKACIYFNGGLFYKGLLLEGTMEVLNDIENKTNLWKNGMEKTYKNGGINDPDYCVLKFTAENGRYYYKKEVITIDLIK